MRNSILEVVRCEKYFPSAFFVAIAALLMTGCSKGVGNPIIPDSPSDYIDHPVTAGGGDSAERLTPALSWEYLEPAVLFEDGWGRTPATIDQNIVFSAQLTGTKAGEFDGKIFISVDGFPLDFAFSNNILNAKIAGLLPGIHHIHLLATSVTGEAGRSFEFEVLSKPPGMAVGIGIEDGKIYITPDRPMPISQLTDMQRWTLDGFNADKVSVEVPGGGDYAVIELTENRDMTDRSWYPPDGRSPEVTFNSSLGEMKATLFNVKRGGERNAQVDWCEKGTVYPIGTCNIANDWVFERTHLISTEREPREVLNAETANVNFNGCLMGGGWSWKNCWTWTVVSYNWAQEGHLDPAENWEAQHDTVGYSTTNVGYKGAGYRDGHWEHY
ncbi:hypothetical protein KKB99_01670, partial [bacterium]|nr:hypothetical protein [bacterium]MBU1024695.1 hypothetical protein [bacterium]